MVATKFSSPKTSSISARSRWKFCTSAFPLKFRDGIARIVRQLLPALLSGFHLRAPSLVNTRFLREDADSLLGSRVLRELVLELFRDAARLGFCCIQLEKL